MDKVNNDVDSHSQAELEIELQKALGELDDVNEMQQSILGQTGIHIGAIRLQKYRSRFDRDRERLEERIQNIRNRLSNIGIESEPYRDEW